MYKKYRVEVYLDGDWRDLAGFPTWYGAIDFADSCIEDDFNLSMRIGKDCHREYRIVEIKE